MDPQAFDLLIRVLEWECDPMSDICDGCGREITTRTPTGLWQCEECDGIAQLRAQLEAAQEIARRAYRCAQHLAIMHRREGRAMEGATGELETIRREAGDWLTKGKADDE